MSTFEAQVTAQNSLDLHEQSEHESDLVGKNPAEVPCEILQRHYREQNPVRAIRARCLDCCCGQLSEVHKCVGLGPNLADCRLGDAPSVGVALSKTSRKATLPLVLLLGAPVYDRLSS